MYLCHLRFNHIIMGNVEAGFKLHRFDVFDDSTDEAFDQPIIIKRAFGVEVPAVSPVKPKFVKPCPRFVELLEFNTMR